MTTDEFGQDLEHVEVLQRKFDEFQKDMSSQEYRVTEVNDLAEKLVQDGHPEREIIHKRKEVFDLFLILCYYISYFQKRLCSHICNFICFGKFHQCLSKYARIWHTFLFQKQRELNRIHVK